MDRTRLAPSPTGSLHLGNARTFLVNWLLARQRGWRIVLRIEDLDGPRVRRGADQETMQDLRWLGLDWDDGPVWQSQRHALYQQAVEQMIRDGVAYPCVCTRSEIETSASAPHAEDGSTIYPGTCRGRFASLEEARRIARREPAVRFRVPEAEVCFHDQFLGDQAIDARQQLGDFVIRRNDGTAAYQLAVVVDDAEQRVTQVVRGADLLDSTARQILIYRQLGLGHSIPSHFHLPLVVGPDGRRLAKRHGDTRIRTVREQGVSPGRVRALLARWCGLETREETEIAELIQSFKLEQVSRESVVWDQAGEQFLQVRAGRE
jgi:glutamyl-tRNA synthetase